MLTPDEESTLIDRLLARDPAAAAQFVQTYSPQMLALARRIMHSEADADDVLQDAFISAFKALPHFERGSRLSTWLHRITVNAALMKLRAAGSRKEASIDALLPTFDQTGHRNPTPAATQSSAAGPSVTRSSPAASPEAVAQLTELRAQVRAAIDQLPDSFRTVLLLRDIEEMDTAETARLLNTTEANVKTRLHRARQALKTLLEPILAKSNS